MLKKLGRPTKMPGKESSFHCSARWENRLWVYKESLYWGITMADVFNELIEAVREEREYDPESVYEREAHRDMTDKMSDDEYKFLLKQRDNAVRDVDQLIRKLDAERRREARNAAHV